MAEQKIEALSFQAKARPLMEPMVHSLSSHREIFLREPISAKSGTYSSSTVADAVTLVTRRAGRKGPVADGPTL
jgi:HSP90 family molecular chaperone